MKALLLIGGLATRLYPLSKRLPKSLLPICDRELLHYQVTQLALAGINEIVLAAGHQVEMLREFTSHYSGGLSFHFSVEPEPRGTAGAIGYARDVLAGEPVVVLNADILSALTLADVISTHQQAKRPATLVGYAVDNPARYGLLNVSGDAITGFSEKPEGALGLGPHYINAGVYVLEPPVYEQIPGGRAVSIEREVFPALINEHGSLTHFPFDGLWNDIGTFESYFKANFTMLARRYIDGEDTLWGRRDDCAVFKDLVYIHKTAKLKGVDLFHRVIVMREATIGDNCRLQNCLVLPQARIGAGTRLTDCIVGPSAEVPAQAKLSSLLLVANEPHVPFYPEAIDAGR